MRGAPQQEQQQQQQQQQHQQEQQCNVSVPRKLASASTLQTARTEATVAIMEATAARMAAVGGGGGGAAEHARLQADLASASQGELLHISEEAVCNTCGCRDERPIPDSDRCAGCEAMADLGDALACCPRSDSILPNRIHWILLHYWQRVGVPRPEPGITAPRPGNRVVINGREMIVPDSPSSSGEEEERDFHPFFPPPSPPTIRRQCLRITCVTSPPQA